MKFTQPLEKVVRRSLRSASAGSAFVWSLVAFMLAAGFASEARADLLVLQTGSSGRGFGLVWRFDRTTGTALGTFGQSNEGFYAMSLTPENEVFVTSNILGGYDLYRFGRRGGFLGTASYGWLADQAGVSRGPDGSLYALVRKTQNTSGWDVPKVIARLDAPEPTTFVANGSGGMTRPTWMIRGPDGNFCVADTDAGILRFNAATGAALGALVPKGRGGLVEAARMIFGPDGRLYVSTGNGNSVLRFDGSTGAFVDTFIAPGAGGLSGAWGLAFGPDGNLYVVSQGTHRVLRYNGSTGAFMGEFVTDSRLQQPLDLAFTHGSSTDSVWFDDAAPAGATVSGAGWTWVASGSAPPNWNGSGIPAHSGTHFLASPRPPNGAAYSFNFATPRELRAGDTLYIHARVNEARQVMLSWHDGSNWEHRAYWGTNELNEGTNGTASRRYMGTLSTSSEWMRLEVPASLVGLEGRSVQGMTITVIGTAMFDAAGIGVAGPTPNGGPDTTPPTVEILAPTNGSTVSGTVAVNIRATDNQTQQVRVTASVDGQSIQPWEWDTTRFTNGPHTLTAVGVDIAGNEARASVTVTVNNSTSPASYWIDDAAPSGAWTMTSGGPAWNWVTTSPAPYAGARALQSGIATGMTEFSFNQTSAPLTIAQDDVLVAHVYLDPANPPEEIMLSFFDGSSWEHRAFWGADLIAYGQSGTAGRLRIGDLPTPGQWVRLVVPARSLGLNAGAQVSSLGVAVHGGRATWDAIGKGGSGDAQPPTVAITAPANESTVTGSITVTATATDNVGVTDVLFQLGSTGIGRVSAPPYSMPLDTRTISDGTYVLSAVARDAAGLTAESRVTIHVRNQSGADTVPPTVAFTSPGSSGAVLQGTTTLAAIAGDEGGSGVASVTFQVDGTTLAVDTQAPYSYVWDTRTVANGPHSVSAIAADGAGNRTTQTLSISVSNGTTTPGGLETVWFDDDVPGGTSGGNGGDGWNWITSNPTPQSGTRAHQSNLAAGHHEHYFDWVYSGALSIAEGDTLFAWVYLDPANPPREIMLSWRSDTWEHRAYWGENLINYGTNGTASRYRVGDLPPVGVWTKLTVPASAVGVTSTLRGMSFGLFGGRATWDAAGKIASSSGGGDVEPPTVALTAPEPNSMVSGSGVTLTATASDNVGVASVEFRAGATVVATDTTAPFSATWNTTTYPNGNISLMAEARDAAGNRAFSSSITVTINNTSSPPTDTTPPTVKILAPAANATVSGATTVRVEANDGNWIRRIALHVDGTETQVVATGANGVFHNFTWDTTSVANGSHSLTAVATDEAGNQGTSPAVIVSVNNNSPGGGAVIWMDSGIPAGAWTGTSGGDVWNWVTNNPAPHAGTRVHQSANVAGLHEHFFVGASSPLQVFAGDTLFVYVYLDPANPPRAVMLSWFDGTWEHRAYWGENLIGYGTDGTASRRRIGALPAAGQWVQLQVPAALVGLERRNVSGMSFSLFDGRATWDVAGRVRP